MEVGITKRVCEQCSVEFILNPRLGLEWAAKTGRGRFCSDPCSRTARKGIRVSPQTEFKRTHEVIESTCVCGIKFQTTTERIASGRGKYCSRECGYRGRIMPSGNKHHNWKDGITPENEMIRKSLLYKKWRKSVFERDDYTCQHCGQHGGYLHADHIKRFADYPQLRFELGNGRTLCISCHRLTPTYGSRKVVYGV